MKHLEYRLNDLIKNASKAREVNFPNPSRSYDETGHGVHFWGYDQAIEIAFFIEAQALCKVNPEMKPDKDEILNTFDLNRDRICAVAEHIYIRHRKTAHIFAYTLTDSDF